MPSRLRIISMSGHVATIYGPLDVILLPFLCTCKRMDFFSQNSVTYTYTCLYLKVWSRQLQDCFFIGCDFLGQNCLYFFLDAGCLLFLGGCLLLLFWQHTVTLWQHTVTFGCILSLFGSILSLFGSTMLLIGLRLSFVCCLILFLVAYYYQLVETSCSS